ncbi:MAG: CHAD domain-containing protein [Planctomycetota bacterium]|jgi:CHAD domain-containing protein
MGYRFRAGEHVDDGIRRMVREQIGRAVQELADGGKEPARAVHQVRKRFKKIRGVLRLARRPLGDCYREENDRYRDLGRQLSSVRDADAMLEAFASLEKAGVGQWDARFESVRKGLKARRAALAARGADLEARVAEVLTNLQEAEDRVGRWPLCDRGFDTIEKGLRRSYARSRREMKRSGLDKSPEAWHEWRKRVKDHWYHVRVLAAMRPDALDDWDQALRALSELLGDDHDLAVLSQWLGADHETYGGTEIVNRFMVHVDARRDRLRFQALDLGGRLFDEKPRDLMARLRRWWDEWQEPATS